MPWRNGCWNELSGQCKTFCHLRGSGQSLQPPRSRFILCAAAAAVNLMSAISCQRQSFSGMLQGWLSVWYSSQLWSQVNRNCKNTQKLKRAWWWQVTPKILLGWDAGGRWVCYHIYCCFAWCSCRFLVLFVVWFFSPPSVLCSVYPFWILHLVFWAEVKDQILIQFRNVGKKWPFLLFPPLTACLRHC